MYLVPLLLTWSTEIERLADARATSHASRTWVGRAHPTSGSASRFELANFHALTAAAGPRRQCVVRMDDPSLRRAMGAFIFLRPLYAVHAPTSRPTLLPTLLLSSSPCACLHAPSREQLASRGAATLSDTCCCRWRCWAAWRSAPSCRHDSCCCRPLLHVAPAPRSVPSANVRAPADQYKSSSRSTDRHKPAAASSSGTSIRSRRWLCGLPSRQPALP
eukprot:COSAG06_NODE_4075_length_4599_cov_98.407333_1_plen_218_part_00